jgi:hypothetical protein
MLKIWYLKVSGWIPMHHLETAIDRGQISIIALEEMVYSDSYNRLVDLFVDALPLSILGFTYAQHES